MCIQYFCPTCQTLYTDDDSIQRCPSYYLTPRHLRDKPYCPAGQYKYCTRKVGQHPPNRQCKGDGRPETSSHISLSPTTTPESGKEAPAPSIRASPTKQEAFFEDPSTKPANSTPRRSRATMPKKELKHRYNPPAKQDPQTPYRRPGDLFDPSIRHQVKIACHGAMYWDALQLSVERTRNEYKFGAFGPTTQMTARADEAERRREEEQEHRVSSHASEENLRGGVSPTYGSHGSASPGYGSEGGDSYGGYGRASVTKASRK